MHVIVVVHDAFVIQAVDQVFPTQSDGSLVEINRTRSRVSDVRGDGEIEQVVGAVALLAEVIVLFVPKVLKLGC